MIGAEIVTRARSVIASNCIYALGKGGFDPASPFPWNSKGECDCSGYVAWCLEVSRHTDHPWYKSQNGGWLETSAIARDCKTPYGMFDAVPWEAARPGDLLVYRDSNGSQGHVGIVTSVLEDGPGAVIHSSKGPFTRSGDAIAETGPGIWKLHPGSLVARCCLVDD